MLYTSKMLIFVSISPYYSELLLVFITRNNSERKTLKGKEKKTKRKKRKENKKKEKKERGKRKMIRRIRKVKEK